MDETDNGIGAIYELLNYMTGDNLFTHQLPRAGKSCLPHILSQHPELRDVTDYICEQCEQGNIDSVRSEMVQRFGETLNIAPISDGSYEGIDPVVELSQMRGGSDSTIV
ncbi:MAG: hypothetical protein ACR2RE_13155 [Geminicoccaceae bacterium]